MTQVTTSASSNVVSYDQVTTTRVVSYDQVTTTGVVSYDQVTTTRIVSYDHITTTRVVSYDQVTTTAVVSYDLVTTLTDNSKLLSPSFHGLQEVANWHCCAQLASYQFNCSTLTRYICKTGKLLKMSSFSQKNLGKSHHFSHYERIWVVICRQVGRPSRQLLL
jgi:hypothetical protein